MKAFIKNTGYLFVIYLGLTGIAYLLNYFYAFGIAFHQTVILLTGGVVISFIVSAIFYSGFSKDEARRVQRTLLAIGLKFLLYAALIGISVLLFKRLSLQFILTFFVIYLTFTIYLLANFVSVLKSKKL